MATCKTCGRPGAPQRGGPCVACLARQSPKAPFKAVTKDVDRAERRGRQQGFKAARAEIPAGLSVLGDEILRRDNERMERELEMTDLLKRNTELMEQIHKDLIKPSDDPEYLKRLQANEAERNAIANKINQIDIVPDGLKSYVGVGSFNHDEAKELSLLLASHFEVSKIRQHE